jgi:hypothetical protein
MQRKVWCTMIALGTLVFCLNLPVDEKGVAVTAQEEAVDLADLVAVTDDWSLNDVDGCDAVSIHNAKTGAPIARGREIASPGRITARRDLSLMVASPANL